MIGWGWEWTVKKKGENFFPVTSPTDIWEGIKSEKWKVVELV